MPRQAKYLVFSAMPALKLTNTIVASIYSKPHHNLDKWLRTPTAISNTLTSTPPPSVTWSRGWSIMSRVSLAPPPLDNNNNIFRRKLGFRGQKTLNSSSSKEEKAGVLGGGSAGQVTDMRSVNKEDQWFESNRSPTSNLPSHNHQNAVLPPPSQHQQSAKLLTLPTILTIGRVAAVPLLVSTFYVNSWWGTTATTSIFIAAAITDWLDGYIARKMKLGSAFGAFLDPVADKLMVAATLVLLCTRPPGVALFGQVPWLLTVPSIAIIGREITMSAVREWAASQNSKLSEAVAVNELGKWKTAAQMTALTILLATRDNSFTEAGILVASGVALLYISAWLAMWSLVVYMRKIWKVLLM